MKVDMPVFINMYSNALLFHMGVFGDKKNFRKMKNWLFMYYLEA